MGTFERLGLLIDFEIALDHARFIDGTIAQQQKDFEETVDAQLRAIAASDDDEFQSERRDFLHDDHERLHNRLPEMQWKAQFVLAFSLFESAMNELCDLAQPQTGLNISHMELHGAGIERCRKYLQKICRLNVFNGDNWGAITRYGVLRNIIVHANARLGEQSVSKINVVAHLHRVHPPSLLIMDYNDDSIESNDPKDLKRGRVVLKSEFVHAAIRDMREFVKLLCDAEFYRVDRD